MEKLYHVYRAKCLVNNKIYIGFTNKSLEERKSTHIKESKRTSYVFHKAIQKYGSENFQWDIIFSHEDCSLVKNIMETFYIIKYNTHYLDGYGYNMTYGGDGMLGYKHNAEIRKKISENRKGTKHTEEWKRKQSERKKANPPAHAFKKGLVPWNKGKTMTEEYIKNMSMALKGRKAPPKCFKKGCVPWNKGIKTGPGQKGIKISVS